MGIDLLLFERPANLQRHRLQLKHLVVSTRFHPHTGLGVAVTAKCDSAFAETKRQSVAAWQLFDGDAALVTIDNAFRNIASKAVAAGAQRMLVAPR